MERSDPSPIRVHPIADALRAVEPKRACRISVHPSIVAQVAVLAGTRAHSCQPFAFGCSELHRAPRVRSGAGVFPERKCVTTPCRAGPMVARLLRGAAATADRGTTNLNKRQREKKVKGSHKRPGEHSPPRTVAAKRS